MHTRSFTENSSGNIFCMYAITPETLVDGKMSFDPKLESFGSHFLAIDSDHISAFLQRIWSEFEAQGIDTFGADIVTYYDPEEPLFQQTSLFMKRSMYSYQTEFRIFVDRGIHKPFSLQSARYTI